MLDTTPAFAAPTPAWPCRSLTPARSSHRVTLTMVFTLLAGLGCGGMHGGGATAGARAPDFAIPDTAGRMVRLSDYADKVVLISFWATWCVPCKAEHPQLQKLYDKYRDQGFVVLCISMDDPETVAEVAPHARRYGLTFPMLLDQETRVVADLNPKKSAPYALLIARDGTIAYTHEGYSPGDELILDQEIAGLLVAEPGAE